MNKKYYLLSFFIFGFLICFQGLMAQRKIIGTVKDTIGNPLPGVGVLEKGTNNEVATDLDGNYSIYLKERKEGTILEFNSLGFEVQEVPVSNRQRIDVILQEHMETIQEVVIVAYGQVKKKDITGAVNQISTDDFNKGPIVTAGQLITGKIAGVSITQPGGAPGSGQNILIRGLGSLSLNSSPLFVIDGVPIDNSNVGGSRSFLNFINPNDIETITVLKDASSTAIYGSRAANGVILITTKKGKRRLNFNYTGSATVSAPIDYVDVMRADEFRTLIKKHGTPASIALLGNAYTDWQKQIYRMAFSRDHFLSASGTLMNFMPFRASIGFNDQDGILKRDNFKRTTASINLTPNLFDHHLKIELNARGMYNENVFGNRESISASVDFDPTQSIYDKNSRYGGYFTWLNSSGTKEYLSPTNPVALINLNNNNSEIRRFIGNATFNYKLHFFPNFTATLNLGYDIINGRGRVITLADMPSSSLDWNGSQTKYSNENTNKLLDFYVNYKKSFNKHSVDAMSGYSYQKFDFYNYNYDSEKEEEGNISEFIDTSASVLMSYFGRLNYNYDNRYLLTASLRADASSKLNPQDRWGYFPSFAIAWNIHNENFLKESNVIQQLKLRIGYGEVGNVNGLGDYNFLTHYTISQSTAYYQFGNTFTSTYRPSAYNEDLRWEVGKTFNAGLDYRLFNSKLSGVLNVYIKKTNDLISKVKADPFTNFSDKVDKNIGDMENKGVEFEVNYMPLNIQDIEWKIGYNISYNHNEITNLPDEVQTGGINGGTGNTIEIHKQGYAPYSFYVYQQMYDNYGKPIEGAYLDRNKDGKINESDKYYYKDPYANIMMGINSRFRYKGIDLSIVTRASLGNYVYNNLASSKSYLNRATENGILTNLTTDYYASRFTTLTDTNLQSDYYVRNASFFKLDNITLGYTLNHLMKDVAMRLYFSVQNVATITDYDGIDPEINGGIDNNFYPRPRSYIFGININF